MKKTFVMFAVATMIIVVSACTKEQNQISGGVEGPITVKLKVNTDTKSQLGADFKTVNWSEGDKIGILDPTSNTAMPTGYVINTVDNTVTVQVPAGATSFYGLYPYNNTAKIAGSKLTTNFPSEQTAVAGNMPNNANVAVGLANISDASITFMNIGAILSFSLDYDDITSVILLSNNNVPISGELDIDYNSGNPTVTFSQNSANTSQSVVLKNEDGSALTRNARYYMVVAPQTLANGLSLILVKSDGTAAVKKSSAAVTIDRNQNINLGAISGLTFENSLYAKYQAGQDVVIAGKTYNKPTNGEALLLDSGINPDLYTSINSKGGVFFLEGNTDFMNSNTAPWVLEKEIILCSNQPSEPVTFKPSGKYLSLKKGSLTLCSINLDLSSRAGYLFNNNNNSASSEDYEALVFDNCIISNVGKSLLYASNNLTVGISKISVTNCRIQMTAGKTLFNAYNCSTMYKYKNVIFDNNVMYSDTPVNAQVFNYANNIAQVDTATWDCSISMKNNIFYNIYSKNGLIKHYILSSLESGHNIYNTTTCGTGSKSFYIFGNKPESATITNSQDVLKTTPFSGKEKGKEWAYNGKGIWNAAGITNYIPIESSEIFSDFNTTTGEYTLNSGYESYGPQK